DHNVEVEHWNPARALYLRFLAALGPSARDALRLIASSCPSFAVPIQFKLDAKYRSGAGDGLRTRYLNLGKVALYRASSSPPSASMVANANQTAAGPRARRPRMVPMTVFGKATPK